MADADNRTCPQCKIRIRFDNEPTCLDAVCELTYTQGDKPEDIGVFWCKTCRSMTVRQLKDLRCDACLRPGCKVCLIFDEGLTFKKQRLFTFRLCLKCRKWDHRKPFFKSLLSTDDLKELVGME